jgi:5-methylcytosine-specific restriction endonuclease McrA
MLRRAENAQLIHRTRWFTKRGPVTLSVGRQGCLVYKKLHRAQLAELIGRSDGYPVCFGRIGERNYWLFAHRWHWDNEDLDADQVYALIVTQEQRNQARINRAQTMVAMQQEPVPALRGAIPDDVKQFVWTRDGGRCRQCGSNAELQFDHIIPVAYGGGSSQDNLQVLCGPCNRRKGASVV